MYRSPSTVEDGGTKYVHTCKCMHYPLLTRHLYWVFSSFPICITPVLLSLTFVFYKCDLIKGSSNSRRWEEEWAVEKCCRQTLMNVKINLLDMFAPTSNRKHSSIQHKPLLPSFFPPFSVWWWYSSLLWRSGRNPSLLPSQHQSSSSLQRAGSDLSPASSWSTPDLPVTAWPLGEPSPRPETTQLPPDRSALRCPWKWLHPLCQRGWRRWQGQRSPPAWLGSCQICLRWWWPAWSSHCCCAQGGPACQPPHHSGQCRVQIWRVLQSYEPGHEERETYRYELRK